MNIIHKLLFLLLFQFAFACNEVLEFSPAPLLLDNQPEQKTCKAVAANIVFKSSDGGQTWQDISEGLPEPVKNEYGVSSDVFFTNDDGLYFTAGNEIYHSKPNFTAPFWNREIFPDSQPRYSREHSSITPGSPRIFAYNYWGGGIFQKMAGTGIWSPAFTNFREKRVRTVFETVGGTVFIGSDNGLFKSTDGGKTWKQLHGGGSGKIVESNGILLATSQRGILRSTDEGENWEAVISEGGVGIAVERIEGGFAAITFNTQSNTRRMRTSFDGGNTWQPIDAGFPEQAFIVPVYNPFSQVNSSDSAWHPTNTNLPEQAFITSIVQVGENFFCGHPKGIFRSSDKGKTWKLMLPSITGKVFNLSVSGNVIYAIPSKGGC